jgi:SecD/SecF fusion protein
MPPILTFLLGLSVLGLFGWYFATEIPGRKRVLGLVLTLLLVSLCLLSIYPPSKTIHLGLDLKGGTEFQIRLVKENKEAKITAKMQETAVEVIRSRVDRFGVGEPVISPVGTDQILVQIPGLDAEKVSEARETLRRVAKLEFRLVNPNSDALIPQIESGATIIPPGYQIMTMEERPTDPLAIPGTNAPKLKPIEKKLLVKSIPDLKGERVIGANAGFATQGWVVNLRLDSEGAQIFGDLTSKHVGEQLAIVLDGKVLSDPVLKSAIYGGDCEISGNFTEASARDLASALENPLSTPVSIEQERSVSATLGKDSIWRGVISGVVGVGLTFVFVLVYYRFAGLLANLALLINIVLLFGMMTMFNFVLTLPGIAGIILTIGLAIDANVLIYERLREELATGKSLRPALEGAYSKAFSSIFDANVTTLITSVILFWQAAGPVKGFAVALTLGIIASLFSALLVTRNAFSWATEKGGLQKIRMLNVLHSPKFDFMGKARYCVLGSLTVIMLCIAVFAYRGQKNFGIDFKGGDLTVLTMTRQLSDGDVRAALRPIHLEDSTIQNTSIPGQPMLTFRSPVDTGVEIQHRLQEAFPHAGVKLGQYDKVGALVGKQLATKSLMALLLGIVGILIYVSFRFEFSFAVGAIVALLHDVIITIGVFSLLGRELSLVLVGAVLTIAGYSINDTIVVYDRIRSGLREGRKGSVREIMNASINETLGRTVLTGGMTLVTVLALYLGGGAVLNDFALAILIGVIVGTYSSVFVASPIVLWFSRGEKARLRPEDRVPGGPISPDSKPLLSAKA